MQHSRHYSSCHTTKLHGWSDKNQLGNLSWATLHNWSNSTLPSENIAMTASMPHTFTSGVPTVDSQNLQLVMTHTLPLLTSPYASDNGVPIQRPWSGDSNAHSYFRHPRLYTIKLATRQNSCLFYGLFAKNGFVTGRLRWNCARFEVPSLAPFTHKIRNHCLSHTVSPPSSLFFLHDDSADATSIV